MFSSSKISVLNVFSIHRPVEEDTFSHDIENKKLLFHASKVRKTCDCTRHTLTEYTARVIKHRKQFRGKLLRISLHLECMVT